MKRGHRWIGYSVLLVLALAFVPAIVLAPHDLIAETDAPSTAGLPSEETMESNVESRAAEGELVLSRPLTFVIDDDAGSVDIDESGNTGAPIDTGEDVETSSTALDDTVATDDRPDGANDDTSGPNVHLGSSSSLGSIVGPDPDPKAVPVVIAEQGAPIVVSGEGYLPNTAVEIWVFSEPTLIGETTTDERGQFSGQFVLPIDIALGDHTIKTFGERPEDGSSDQPIAEAPLVVVDSSESIETPLPATLTYTDGSVKVDYNADQVWLRLNGEWITASLAEPIELAPGDTLTVQVRNCSVSTCSRWVFSTYTVNVAPEPDAPVVTFERVDDYSGVLGVTSDAEQFEITLDDAPVGSLPVAVTGGQTFSVSARNCGGLDICSDWVTSTYVVSVGARADAPVLTFTSVDSYSGTMTVDSDDSELELFVDGEQVTEIPDLVFGDQVIVARARNCADVCSEWVESERKVTVAESPGAADIEFTSLSPYTGQLEISSLAEEVEAALNGERVLAGLVAVVGGDVLTVRTRNCSGADVCSPWDDASHEVSVDAAPDAAAIVFTSEGPYSGVLAYTVEADEFIATFDGDVVDDVSFEVTGGEVLRVEARNCRDAETCSEWVIAEHTVSVADTPDAAALIYNNEFLDIVHDADEMELSTDGGATYNPSAAVSWGVNVGDTVDVRIRNCDDFDICSVWVDSDYLVTQADEPTAASIIFEAIDSYTGELVVTHGADEAVMILDGDVVTGTITAVGHQELVVNIRDCDGFDVCSDWVETRYTVSVAATPTAADITFARTTDFAGELTVTHSAEEEILDLDGDTTVTSPVAVEGLETLDVNIRNCAGTDVCSPWVETTRTVTVAPVPVSPTIFFATTGDYSRDITAVTGADKHEARLDSSVVALPVTVNGGETLVVEAWNCDGYDICSDPASSVDTHTVSIAPTPDAAELTYNNGNIDIDHAANQMELSTDGGTSYNASGAVSVSVAVGDTVDVRIRNCDDYDICSVWVNSDYLVTQADEPTAASIVFEAIDSYTGELVVTHGADEAVMALDGDVVTGTITAVGHQELVVNIRDCDGFDVCSEWVETRYTVSVATTPTAADISFARTTDFAGQLTVTHSAEEQILDLDGDTTVTSPIAVTGLETLNVNIRNCAGTDVCSPWVPSTHEVTVAPVPDAPVIGFTTTGAYSRNLGVTTGADKYEARLNSSVVELPVTVYGGETLVVETWNCDGYDICSNPTSSVDTHTVSVAPTPDAAELTYSPGFVNIDHDADEMQLSWNNASYATSSAAARGVNIGDTVDVRVRNCGTYDICSVWVDSDYEVTQAPAANEATFAYTSTGDYSANITISHNAEHVEVTVDGDIFEGLVVPVTGGEVISVDVWDCDGFDECSTKTTSTYTVQVADDPDQASFSYAAIDSYSGTLSVSHTAEEMKVWFNSTETTSTSFTVTGGESLVAHTRDCGTEQICSQWVEASDFVTTDDTAAAAALVFTKDDDDNGTITVTYEADEILLYLDDVAVTGSTHAVTAGQKLEAKTRNCDDAYICSAWTDSERLVTAASQPAQPVLTFASVDAYNGTVNIEAAAYQDRIEATLTRNGTPTSETLPVSVVGLDAVTVKVRGCDDGDLCSPWSTNTYTVSQAASTSTPTFTPTRIGGNFDSISTSVAVDFGTVEELQIFADSTSDTLLSDSTATVTIAKADGYSSLVARSRNCSGSDVCSPWADAAMNVTTHANPAAPIITLDENGFVVTADGDSDRSSFNEAAFVEASGNLTSVPAVENDTLTVETRNCGDVNTWTFCSDVMSVGPALYVPAPEAATLTWDTSDYLLEVDFDATHIKIETGNRSTIYVTETTYTKAAFEAAHPNGINCRPGWLWTWQLRDCFVDIEVWNESGSYGSLAVPSDRFIVNEAAGVVGPPFTFNIDVETGEVLSVVPRVTPNNADIITDFTGGGLTLAGPFTCENDWTCPALFDSIVGNSYPAGATFNFLVESWTDGLNDVHLPRLYNQIVHVQKTYSPTSVFDTLTAGLTGISQPYSGTPAYQSQTATNGTHMFEYSVDGGSNWVSLPDVTGGTINTNLTVDYDVLYPGGVPVPSLDFRARYCAGSNAAHYIFFCGDWSTIKSYTQGDLTADTPEALTLLKWPEWSESSWHHIYTHRYLFASVTQFRVDNGEWSDDWFGGHNSNSLQSGWIYTPGSYQSRQQNCGMAAGGCSSGGTNVFPSEWVYADIEITQTPAPTVELQPNTTGGTGANTCLETYKNGTAVKPSRYTINDGPNLSTDSSWCIGGFSDGDQVIAYVHHYDSSYDLAAEETASAVYTVSQADHPDITVNIDPLTGSTTLSSATGSDVTFAYAIGNGVFTEYSGAFTVEADDWLRVRAYNCQPDKTLCGYTYEDSVITQAGNAVDPMIYFDISAASNGFMGLSWTGEQSYVLTSFKVNGAELTSGPISCDTVDHTFIRHTCLADLATTLGFGELMAGDVLEYTLYNMGDAHLAGSPATFTKAVSAHVKDTLTFGTAETTADGFRQPLTGSWSGENTLFGAFQYSTDGANWTALPAVSTTTLSVAGFVAEVPNSVLYNNGNPISELQIRFRTCDEQFFSAAYDVTSISSGCKDWQTTSYTQTDLTGAAVAAPSLAWNNSTQTIDITNLNVGYDVQYSTDGTDWGETAFGTITTPGTYHVRHRTCGTANDASCATGGMNVYPSAWESASYTVTQAAQPSVGITVSQSTEKATITASAGTVTYDVDGGTENSYTAPFAVTANTTVNAAAQDCSLDLCSTTGTYSLPITQHSDPVLSVSIDQDTGATTVSYGTSTKTEYDIGSGVTDYNDTSFTVVKDTNMTVTAVDCDGVLCSGISTVTKTITQAAAPTVNITINDENGAVSLSPSVDATETTYDIGSGYVAYTSSFTPADGTVVNASARNCSTDLCSLAGTDSLTVTYGTTPTVTITMDDSGNLVVTTDTASADTEVHYGWASGSTTTTYSSPLATSDYSFGDTLYVEARSKDGANVWSPRSAEQSFATMGATVSAAVTTTPNSNWTEMTFTSTGNDIEYQVLSSYDSTGVTGAVWTEGTVVTIRDNSNGYIDATASGADGSADHNYNMSIAVISTRARDCVNVNVEGSCSSWVEEVGVTYGNETMPFPAAADRVAQNSDGDIYTTFTTECDFDRCMPIANIYWWFDVDQLTAGNDGSDLQASHTFVSSRSDNSYVEATSGVEVGGGIFTAVAGQVVSGDLGSSFGSAAIDTAGQDMEPRVCIKRLYLSVAWSGSATGWSTVAAQANNPGRSSTLC